MDGRLAMAPRLRYMPWIGSRYRSLPFRIMIVAESVYNDEPENADVATVVASSDYCRAVISHHGLFYKLTSPARHLQKSRIARALEGLLLDDNICDNQRGIFWESVVYHQFVQRPMAHKKARPNATDYACAGETLPAVIDILSPSAILFLGTDMRKLPGLRSHFGGIALTSLPLIGKSRPRHGVLSGCPFLMIRHPSSYFSVPHWRAHLDTVCPEIRRSFTCITERTNAPSNVR